jgi:hypothetical protein
MIRALRDPDGANLDRIQMVKGWVDADREPKTKVFDVAWSGERQPDSEGRLPPVGSTVDGASFANTIGAAVLGGYWVDPEFDPAQRAYYYVRVLEIPTPSWLAYDEAFYGPLDLPDDAVMVQQKRAYTRRRSGIRVINAFFSASPGIAQNHRTLTFVVWIKPRKNNNVELASAHD